MSGSPIIRQLLLFLVFVLGQIPLLHSWVLFDYAFAFIYVAFLLFLPFTISRFWALLIGFGVGIMIDVFSNTPGLHAMVSVFSVFIRRPWLRLSVDNPEEIEEVNLRDMGFVTFVRFVFPILFIHLLLLFTIENEGFRWLGDLMLKVFFSSLFSFFTIWLLSAFLRPKKTRS